MPQSGILSNNVSPLIIGSPELALGVSIPEAVIAPLTQAQLDSRFDQLVADGITAVIFDLDTNWVVFGAAEPANGFWTTPDRVVDACMARNIELTLRVVGTPEWARAAGQDGRSPWNSLTKWSEWMTRFAQRYANRVKYWQIMNEVNTEGFWYGTLSASTYVSHLAAARTALRAVNPEVVVIAAGLSPVPTPSDDPARFAPAVDYYDQMVTAGLYTHADMVAIHPYSWPLAPTDPASFNGWNIMLEISQRSRLANRPLVITEYGSPTRGTNSVPEATQAAHIQSAYDLCRGYNWLFPTLYLYSDRDRSTDSNTEASFGWRLNDGTPKLARATVLSLSQRRQIVGIETAWSGTPNPVVVTSRQMVRNPDNTYQLNFNLSAPDGVTEIEAYGPGFERTLTPGNNVITAASLGLGPTYQGSFEVYVEAPNSGDPYISDVLVFSTKVADEIAGSAPPPPPAPRAPSITSVTISPDSGGVGADFTANYVGDLGVPAATVSYQWRRNGVNIAGATSRTFDSVNVVAPATLSCVVTLTNSQGTVSANDTAEVTAIVSTDFNITVSTAAQLTSAVAGVPSTLTGTYVIGVAPGNYGSFSFPSGYQRGTTGRVVLRATNESNRPVFTGITLSGGGRRVTFDGIRFLSTATDRFGFPSGGGLNLDSGAQNIVVRNCTFDFCFFCIRANNVNGLTVEWCDFTRWGNDVIRAFNNGVANIRVANCDARNPLIDIRRSDQTPDTGNTLVRDLDGIDVLHTAAEKDARHPDFIQLNDTTQNVVVEDCRISLFNGYHQGVFLNNQFQNQGQSTGTRVSRCFIEGSHVHGITLSRTNNFVCENNVMRRLPGTNWNSGVSITTPTIYLIGTVSGTITNCVVPSQRGANGVSLVTLEGGATLNNVEVTNLVRSDTAFPPNWSTFDVARGRYGPYGYNN